MGEGGFSLHSAIYSTFLLTQLYALLVGDKVISIPGVYYILHSVIYGGVPNVMYRLFLRGGGFLKVIAHLIGMELSQHPEISLRDATANALLR